MAKAERQGWNTWDRYLKAGVVEETLIYNDDAVIVDNTLGRTQNTIGICWPIDAAVAYTLASHGPQAQLTLDDLVNQNTKIAAVMMHGYVQWGSLKNPHAEACNHDMVDCVVADFGTPYTDKHGCIGFNSTSMKRWEHWEDMPQNLKDLCVFRMDKTWWESNFSPKSVILSNVYAEVRQYIMDKMGSSTFNVGTLQNHLDGKETTGVCGWRNDDEKKGQCAHHNDTLYEGWVMIRDAHNSEGYEKLWYRGKGCVVSAYTHRDPLRDRLGWNYASGISRDRVVVFDRVKRSLAQTIPDDVVKEHIKGSIARMRKWDGRCLVDKEGRGKTARHKWSDWEWLAEIATWVQDTRSKNRKEHETQCNICYANGEEDADGKSLCRCEEGWRYTKFDVKTSFTHEIAKFEWRPIDSQRSSIYALKVSDKYLPWRFKSKEEAAQMREFFAMTATRLPNISLESRTWDLATGQEHLIMTGKDTGISVVQLGTILRMKWDKDPENLPTPRQALEMIQWGNPIQVRTALENLKEAKFKRRGSYNHIKNFEFPTLQTINAIENIMEPTITITAPEPEPEPEEYTVSPPEDEDDDDNLGFGGLGSLFG